MNKEIDVLRQSIGPALRPAVPESSSAAREAPDRIDLRWLGMTLRRRLRLLLAIMLAIVAIALMLTYLQAPAYTATSEIVLNVGGPEYAPDTRRSNDKAFTQDAADTEIEVIRSRVVAEQVAAALVAQRPDVVAALLAPRGGPVQMLRTALDGPTALPNTPEARRRTLVGVLRDHLKVQRNSSTFAVTIAYTAAAPVAAAEAANAFANAYTGGQLRDKQLENRSGTDFLRSRLEELRLQANADNEQVQRFRIANNLLSTSGASLTEQEISSYNQRVADARTEAAGDQARLETARSQLRGGSKGDDVGEALGSSVVSGLRGKRAEVSARVATLTSRYGALHPDVINARQELADVDKEISAEIGRVVSNLEARAQVSRDRLSAISSSLNGAKSRLADNNAAAVQLDDLTRRAEASQQLYESYLNRYKEMAAREGTERSDSRIVSRAEPPARPSSPNMILNLALGLVLGGGLGLAGALGAEMAFAGLTTGEEVEARLGHRFLGGIPNPPDAGAALIDMPVREPRSLFAQALRNLGTSLNYATRDDAQVIAITSALPREGKTVTAIAFARSIALNGDAVVLLDCDHHTRRLSRMLRNAEGRPGLLEVLQGTASLEDALICDQATGVWLLPTFALETMTPALLTGPAMTDLLNRLRQDYRYIVLDTPPILPVAEAREIAAKADAVLLLVRWRRTADHAVRTALRMLPRDFVNVVGVALTAVDAAPGMGIRWGDAGAYHKQFRGYLN